MDGPMVALVNDDRRLLDLAGDLLQRSGFRTVGFTLGDDTFANLRRNHLDLIVLGATQVRPDAAWQLLTLARLDSRLAGVPAILCSPDGQMLAERAAHLRSMHCEVLVEPFTATTLLAKVQAAFITLVSWHHND
jgi:DNA-binding response OmpR family regulator